ncbi:MAG: tyrosine-type recombinase/integrase [Oligoflexia bacterium]|jgi:site-specific recombinase XerD
MPARKSPTKQLTFAQASHSFVGYLEGTGKASHTITNYKQDLGLFERFVMTRLSRKPISVNQLTLNDLKTYSEYLRAQGFHDNTRRRRLLTVRRFLEYLTRRKKLSVDLGRRLPAPHKIEKVPRVTDAAQILDRVREIETDGLLQLRNRVLLATMLETGALVSEVAKIQFDQWDFDRAVVTVHGPSSKRERPIPVSQTLLAEVASLRERSPGKFLFLGFNRFGPLTATPMTPRGVELLVRAYAERLGVPELTPRMIRHSVVVMWSKKGARREQIREWLGLRTDYAFRAYAPLLLTERDSTTSV